MDERKQRLRVTFSKGWAIRFISHLDLMRAWERLLRRAQVPVVYSRGYNPRPRMALAAPLPVGFTGGAELMDLYLCRYVSPFNLPTNLSSQMPEGLDVKGVEEVYMGLPSLQSQVRLSEYRITLPSESISPYSLGEAVRKLLAAEELPYEQRRQDRVKALDLRGMIDDVWIQEIRQDEYDLAMRLQTDSRATGRPDQVLEIMGLGEVASHISRTRLLLGAES